MEPEVSCVGRDETLSAFMDNELGQRERLRVEAHLDSCARCRQEIARCVEGKAQWIGVNSVARIAPGPATA